MLFLFFIKFVNLIITKVIIPQYTNGKIGRVNAPIILISTVVIFMFVTIIKPRKAAIKNRNSIILSLINTDKNLDDINILGFIGSGKICSISPEK